MSYSDYLNWSERYDKAETEDDQAKLAEEIECDLELIGSTAIEDKL